MYEDEERLTKEHYKIAEKNGINWHNAYQRYYVYCWTIEEAITIPIGKRRCRLVSKEEETILKENGISKAMFSQRLHKGWSRYEALHTKNLGVGGKRKWAY